MTTMDIIKELTDELAIKNVYQSLKEQQMQPEYSNLEFEKRVQLLLESESFERKNKKIKRLLNEAKLPDKTASIEDINFSIANRVLDKSLILELASLKFIENSNNITQLSHIVNHKFLYKKASLNPINRHFLI